MTPRPFLTARWENLAIVSYAVTDDLLAPHIPRGLVLDRRGGRAFASLVAFDFRQTRVFGRCWPRCVNFPEVNLRFYVKDPGADRRGVCFVREFVQPWPVVLIARRIYNEPYARACMGSRVAHDRGAFSVEHSWRYRGREHTLRVVGAGEGHVPQADSDEHWFKEHEWGFGRDRRGGAITYRVEHPVWAVHPVTSWDLDIDYAALYGPSWEVLNGREPDSVILAAGSEVVVFPRLGTAPMPPRHAPATSTLSAP